MTAIVLRMMLLGAEPARWHEAAMSHNTTLKELENIIQEAFDISGYSSFAYEVFGCRSASGRARLRHLTAAGVTRFRYVANGAGMRQVEIVMDAALGALVRRAVVDRQQDATPRPYADRR